MILSEQELHQLVEESVKIYLVENGMINEFMDGVKGGLSNVWQGVKSGNLNVAANYGAGKQSSQFAKFANQAQQAIDQMNKLAKQMKNQQVCQYLDNASKTIKQTAQMFQKQATAFAKQTPQNAFNKFDDQQMQKMGYGNTLLTNKQAQTNQANADAVAAGGTGAAGGGAGTGAAGGAGTTATTGTVGGKRVPKKQNMKGLPQA